MSNRPTTIDVGALERVKAARDILTWRQYRTLRGMVLAGDAAGAMRGLRKILLLAGTNAVKK